jgi:hypothetical protein
MYAVSLQLIFQRPACLGNKMPTMESKMMEVSWLSSDNYVVTK